jgi:hypothetical protein
MSRYSAHENEMEADRQRHARREAEEWAEDRRVSELRWRESEARRAREAREAGGIVPRGQWEFKPVYGEGEVAAGTMPGWQVFVNSVEVGLIVQTPRGDMIVFAKGDPGELLAHRLSSVGTEDIMAAFEAHSQRQLGTGR